MLRARPLLGRELPPFLLDARNVDHLSQPQRRARLRSSPARAIAGYGCRRIQRENEDAKLMFGSGIKAEC